MATPKVLVTGGAGFIGSHVVDACLAEGFQVVVVDDLSAGRASNLNPSAVFYECDIRSGRLAEIFERERPEFVNHHAAQIDVRRSIREPVIDAEINILGSLNLLECARKYSVRKIVYSSSGGAIYGEPVYQPCDENHPIQPISPYGASKYTVERYLAMYYALYGIDYTVLRYANVYGPRQDPFGEAGVVAIFARQMLAGQRVTINGDGLQERDFIYVQDCAEANRLALRPGAPNGAFNLGTGEGVSINRLAAELAGITGSRLVPDHAPEIKGETRRITLDCAKAGDQLGWRPAVALADGLTRTVEYFRTNEAIPQEQGR